MGNYYTRQFSYLQLDFERCLNKTTSSECKPIEDIEQWMSDTKISLAFTNQYLDLENFGKEIKQFIDDSVFLKIEKGTRKSINLYIQRNKAVFKGDIVKYGKSEEAVEYYIVGNKEAYQDDFGS